jgi:hypothetical protein
VTEVKESIPSIAPSYNERVKTTQARSHPSRLRLLVPLLLLAAIALNRLGIVEGPGLVAFFVALEVAFAVYVLGSIALAVRAYRRHTRQGGLTDQRRPTAYETAVAALQEVFPSGIARFLAMEPFLYWDLLRWLLRLRERAEGQPFSYSSSITWKAILAILLVSTPAEVLLLEVLIPWAWLRVLALIAAVWALAYFFGMFASLRLRPHLLRGDGTLTLRYGHFFRVDIPVAAIQSVSALRMGTQAPKRGFGVTHAPDGVAYLPGTEEPRVALVLREPVSMGNVGETPQPVQELRVYADAPRPFVEAVEQARNAASEEDASSRDMR